LDENLNGEIFALETSRDEDENKEVFVLDS